MLKYLSQYPGELDLNLDVTQKDFHAVWLPNS